MSGGQVGTGIVFWARNRQMAHERASETAAAFLRAAWSPAWSDVQALWFRCGRVLASAVRVPCEHVQCRGPGVPAGRCS